MGQMISFPRTGGKPANGYLAEASDPRAPAVVVIQEWWGLQGQIKALCDRFAAEGLHALAPDLYDGRVIPYHDKAAASAAMGALDFKAAVDEGVRGAVQHLKARGAKVGLTGFCMGGAITVIGAVRLRELDAAVCFYGVPPDEVASARDIKVPFQAHFANEDDWCTPEVVDAFERKLSDGGKLAEVYRYQARHAFMNSERKDAYQPEAAKLAWERCVNFFKRMLA